jgi:2-polyprenyl-3-methyl-5-hydroxy-6-metoxy-1,4-benzoquinol methylase
VGGGREIESDVRIAGLEEFRRENFRVVLDRLEELRPLREASVLDVGSAYGWFVDEADRRGAQAEGIEPDEHVAARAIGPVRVGTFPSALSSSDQFDVIAFNDVLEHLPDPREAVEVCRQRLRPRGLLSVNIPTADGLAFRVACALARAGIDGPYRRLWQQELASPHTHYFSTQGIVRLVESSGLHVRAIGSLPSVIRKGLWQRVHTVHGPTPSSVFGFACLYGASGLLNRPASSDIVHLIAERTDTY